MSEEHCDTFFFDPQTAHRVALQGNRVKVLGIYDGLQICYALDTPFIENPPENLVQLPVRGLLDFFTHSLLRPPAKVVLSDGTPEQRKAAQAVADAVRLAQKAKEDYSKLYTFRVSKQKPDFRRGKPLRIFATASRHTTVMQYCMRDLANAFRRLGHEVRFLIEQNAMEQMSDFMWKKSQFEFNPHICLNINHQNNTYLSPEVINVTWWQDPMPALTRGAPLRWRERDLVYSYCRQFDNYLEKVRAPRIERQVFCIDTQIFRVRPDIERRRKVVFIGSSYCKSLQRTPQEASLAEELQQLFVSGAELTEEMTRGLAVRFGVDPGHAFWRVLAHVERSTTVRWLCMQQDVEVEVYGRHWEEDDIVRPFFKGEVPHGTKVAEIYNSARYALVCHPNEIQTQRLCEAAACGCIPVVYDCRFHAEPPFWDDCCLFFRTQEELRACLKTDLEPRPALFADYYSYERFARRVLERTWELVEGGA